MAVHPSVAATNISFAWRCGQWAVHVDNVLLKAASRYMERKLRVSSVAGASVLAVRPFGSGLALTSPGGGPPSAALTENGFNPGAGHVAAWARFGPVGAFVTVANPFTRLGATVGGGGHCQAGVNYRNGDLPHMPLKGVADGAACEELCRQRVDCKAYVWVRAGCEGTPAPGHCYLKQTLTDRTSEECTCALVKPFPTPSPPAPGTRGVNVTAEYAPTMAFGAAAHETDGAIIGLTGQLGKYAVAPGVDVFVGERQAFVACVEEHQLDTASREHKTVKINVAWDESDYQIDVGTAAGRAEYRRIIDRNAELGVTHIVYEPRNTLHASRFNSTDGWGWEASLWFGMGEQIREGRFDPRTDDAPADIVEMVQYAKSRGIGLCSYVYPALHFAALKQWWVGSGIDVVNLGVEQVQEYFIQTWLPTLRQTSPLLTPCVAQDARIHGEV